MVVLKNEVEASRRSAEQLAAELAGQSNRGVLCMEVEELLRSVVAVRGNIARTVDDWQSDPAGWGDPPTLTRQFYAMYADLEGVCVACRPLIAKIEAEGFVVDGKAEFRAAYKAIREVTMFPVEAVLESAAQAARGEGRPLEEVMRELQDHPDAAGD